MPLDLPTLIHEQTTRRKELQELERFILQDQWAAGRGWTGPNPVDLDQKQETAFLDLVERQFVSRNILSEVITRHRDGVLSREPSWSLGVDAPRGRKTLIAEAETALTKWWDETGAHQALQEAVRTLMFAAEASRRGEPPAHATSPLRLFIRSQSITNGIIPKRATLEEALNDLRVHAAAPYAAGVIRNLDGDPIATQYAYKDEDGTDLVEITGVAGTLREYGVELPIDAHEDATVVLVTDSMSGNVREAAAYDLNGRLLMHEMRREPLINESAISLQKLVNKTWTMMSHNMDVAGFTERTFLNAQMPGKWVDADGHPTTPENGVRFVPDELFVGAGATNFISGLPQVDADGNVRYAPPSVQYRDPVPPVAFTDTIEAARAGIYEEAKQLHVLISGDATSSGRSRVQAANDFVASLELTSAQVAYATRWLLSTALSLASVLMGQPGRYEELRPTVTPRLAAVQPTAEDIASTIAKLDASLISVQTARSEVGVEDVDAERELVEQDQAAAAARTQAAGLPTHPSDPHEDEDEDE